MALYFHIHSLADSSDDEQMPQQSRRPQPRPERLLFHHREDSTSLEQNEGPEERNIRIAVAALLSFANFIGAFSTSATPSSGITKAELKDHSSTYRCTQREKGQMCCICCQEFDLRCNVLSLRCNHLYHPKCITRWTEEHKECPLCKRNVLSDPPAQCSKPTEAP